MKVLGYACASVLMALIDPAFAADPPRVEQLSNPQSQTVGKKLCAGYGPAVWVPYSDPCPGASQSGSSDRSSARSPSESGGVVPNGSKPKPPAEVRSGVQATSPPALTVIQRYERGQRALNDGRIDHAVIDFTAAAEAGHSQAQYMLGLLYEGGDGVPKNEMTALSWYRKSAAQGNFMAQAALDRKGQVSQLK